METEQNNTSKEAVAPKIDIWDRIIKLDQRNSQLTMFGDQNLPSQQSHCEEKKNETIFWWTEGQVEKNIRRFWEHIDEIYFQNMSDEDVGRIDRLAKVLEIPKKECTVKYTSPESYETFKAVIDDRYRHQYSNSTLDSLNIQNLQKYFYVSELKSKFACNKLIEDRDNSKKGNSNEGSIKIFLNREARNLDNILNDIWKEEKNEDNKIDIELQEALIENQESHLENLEALSDLKEQIMNERNLSVVASSRSKGNSNRKALKSGNLSTNLESSNIKEMQIDYLQKLIVRLENQQTAETIKCVIDCKKVSGSAGYRFCVVFDESITTKRHWIEESVLETLDGLRERSLFKIYDVPQKIKGATYSPNILGFECCHKSQEPTQNQRDKKWKELMKSSSNDISSKEKLQEKLAKKGVCHHCRHLFPDEFLVNCSFSDSIINLQRSRSNLKIKKDYANKRLIDLPKEQKGERRPPYLFYQIENGEITCYRRYCRLCMKLNYDADIAQNLEVSDFICPFCKKTCCCSRCLRNDHIDKLRTLYISFGGNLENIKDSYFSEFVGTGDSQPEEIINSKQTLKLGNGLKPTRGRKPKTEVENGHTKAIIEKYKQSANKLKFMKNLRIDLEKARMICSQVAKRESLKMQLIMVKNETFSLNTRQAFNLTGKKREGVSLGKKFSDEPAVQKKVKIMTESYPYSNKKQEMEDSTEENGDEEGEEMDQKKGAHVVSEVIKKRGRPRKIFAALDGVDGKNTVLNKSHSPKELIKKQIKNAINKTHKTVKSIVKTKKVFKETTRGRSKEDKETLMNLKEQKNSSLKKQSQSEKQDQQSCKSETRNNLEKDDMKIKSSQNQLSTKSEKTERKRSKSPLIPTKQTSNNNYKQAEKPSLVKKELQRLLDYDHEGQFEVFNTTKGMGRVTRNSYNKNKLRNNKKYHYSQSFQS